MQKRSPLMLVCGAVALVFCAGAQATSLSRADREFMNQVATMDMTGAHEGQMAQDKAANPQVKDFARMLVKDESESFGHLAELANRNGVSIPRGINAAKIPEIRGLAGMSGARFDHQFTRDEVNAEQDALTVFKHEAKYGQSNDLKAYANNMIPVVTNDLKRAQECANAAK